MVVAAIPHSHVGGTSSSAADSVRERAIARRQPIRSSAIRAAIRTAADGVGPQRRGRDADRAPLLSEEFAPTTSRIGFLNSGLNEATAELTTWRRELRGVAKEWPLVGPLSELVPRLEPLTGGVRPRELLIATRAPGWTAYLDCGVQGTDAEPVVSVLSQRLGCKGLVVVTVPHTLDGSESPGRYGAVQFTLVGPKGDPPLRYVRVLSAAHDGHRWVFHAIGQEQEFETPDVYRARKVRDRFTSETLAAYCAAMGLHPFVPEFYGSQAVLVETDVTPPPEGKVLTLRQAQEWQGIKPGLAASLPG